MIAKTLSLLACLGGLTVAGTAVADDDTPITGGDDSTSSSCAPQCATPVEPPPPASYPPSTTSTYTNPPAHEEIDPWSYAWHDPRLASGIGINMMVGGGVTSFVSHDMREGVGSNLGGLWDLRMVFGSHIPLAIELGYSGTAQSSNTFTGDSNGTLLGTTVEGTVRWNVVPHADFTPYLFGGVGWQRYDLLSKDFAEADSGVNSGVNMLEVPAGLGLTFRDAGGFTFDARGTFRFGMTGNLFTNPLNGNQPSTNTWEASALIGYEY